MACSCKTRQSAMRLTKGAAPSPTIPHSVHPGESCIYCAEKHASTAYNTFIENRGIAIILGELELARRHTIVEYPDACKAISNLLYRVSTRDIDTVGKEFTSVLEAIDKDVKRTDKGEATKATDYILEASPVTMNPFVGELHVMSAYRLASEIGYMLPNRQMIIGDLALAREHLIRFFKRPCETFRDLRHRVQTTKAADLDIFWPTICNEVLARMNERIDEFREKYSDGLKKYLNI